jgi:hypothetical protein
MINEFISEDCAGPLAVGALLCVGAIFKAANKPGHGSALIT